MKIRQISIRRFRGIAELDWSVPARAVCLIGPGDSTKSTILTAIEYALLPHSALRLTDADFYNCDPGGGFTIRVTVGDVPSELLTEAKFGLQIRGMTPAGILHDEPENGDAEVLTIRLTADASLEPRWDVENDRNGEGVPIGQRDRAKLGMVKLGQEIDRDLSWTRYSALTKFTDEGMSGVSPHLSEAHRQAREAIRQADLGTLNRAAKRLEKAARDIGVAARTGFQALLEPSVTQMGIGALSIHDGDVPVRSAGVGTRRLVALALQAASVAEGAIVLVDEIETALEPHRLRHLVRVLTRNASGAGERPWLAAIVGSCLFTTHSPSALRELGARGTVLVRNDKGATSLVIVPEELDRLVRSQPEAVLSRRVLVCEGATEQGFCRALDDHWVANKGAVPMAVAGTATVNGAGGTQAESFARAFLSLGFETGLLGDTDVPGEPDGAGLSRDGVTTFLWDGGTALEERIALDLPDAGLPKFLELAVEEHGPEPIAAELGRHLDRSITPDEVQGWCSTGLPDATDQTRRAIGAAAKGKQGRQKDRGWFKQREAAYGLGTLVADCLPEMEQSPLAQTIGKVMAWVCRG